MKDFRKLALSAIKKSLEGLPSLSRLVMYELLEYCDFQAGIISLPSLEELACNDFLVVSSPGRKKEEINSDAFRTNKKAKSDLFKFSTKTQRELHQQYRKKDSEIAAVVSQETNTLEVLAGINLAYDLREELFGEDETEIVAASYYPTSINNNFNKKLNKQTQKEGQVSNNFLKPIAPNFYPSKETIAAALKNGLNKVTESQENQKFINHIQEERQTLWPNFSPIFFNLVAR